MGPSAEMFNEIAANPIYKFEKVLQSLQIKEGDNIADIGSGGGFYTLKLAKLTNTGKVFAIDIRPNFLEYIDNLAQQQNINNVQTILATNNVISLPSEHSIDVIFMRNVSHHLSERSSYFKILKKFLKSTGRFVIIDYTPEGNRDGHGPPGHFVNPVDLLQEMKQAGYEKVEEKSFLPGQFFMVFKISA